MKPSSIVGRFQSVALICHSELVGHTASWRSSGSAKPEAVHLFLLVSMARAELGLTTRPHPPKVFTAEEMRAIEEETERQIAERILQRKQQKKDS